MRKILCLVLIVMASLVGCKGPDTAVGEAIESFAANHHANYILSYAHRYVAYAEKHGDTPYSSILAAVNLGLDQPNYENVYLLKDPQSLTVLVNKHYGLPKKFRPDHLVSVDSRYAQPGVMLREDSYTAFLSMVQDMEKEEMSLYIKSGYRINSKRGGANSLWYAWPGHSEHQTGLAFDLRKKGVSYKTLSEYEFEETREYVWLCENAHRYGFVLSFPEDKSNITGFGFEPWHWRYVGIDIATDMKKKDFDTYQEYWATFLIQDVMQ
ncbi:MAG: M15 family metallopeptidase [Bacillota bacterium]